MPGIAWKRWNWLEWGIVPLVSTMMYAAWLGPLFQLLLGLSILQPRGLNYPAWLIMALLLGASTAKGFLAKVSSGRLVGALIGVAAVIAVLIGLSPYRGMSSATSSPWLGRTIRSLAEWQVAVPATFLVVILSALLWAKGLAADWADHDELWRAFASGVLVLGLLILLSGRNGAGYNGLLGRAVISFLLTGLLALALLSVLSVLAIQHPYGKHTAGLSRYWLLAVLLALVTILALGWLLGLILAPDAVAQFVRWFDPLRRFVGRVLSFVLTAIVYVLFLALMALYNLVRRLLGHQEVDATELMKESEDLLRETEEGTRSLNIPPDLRLILVLLFLFLGAVSLFWLVWRQRRRQATNDQVLEERQSIGSRELLLDQLNKLFRRPPHRDPFLDLSTTQGSRRAIRVLYRRILTAAKAAGHPRARGHTPSTYGLALTRILPGRHADLHVVTEAYMVARYGEQDPPGDVVERAVDATARVEQALREHQAH